MATFCLLWPGRSTIDLRSNCTRLDSAYPKYVGLLLRSFVTVTKEMAWGLHLPHLRCDLGWWNGKCGRGLKGLSHLNIVFWVENVFFSWECLVLVIENQIGTKTPTVSSLVKYSISKPAVCAGPVKSLHSSIITTVEIKEFWSGTPECNYYRQRTMQNRVQNWTFSVNSCKPRNIFRGKVTNITSGTLNILTIIRLQDNFEPRRGSLI